MTPGFSWRAGEYRFPTTRELDAEEKRHLDRLAEYPHQVEVVAIRDFLEYRGILSKVGTRLNREMTGLENLQFLRLEGKLPKYRAPAREAFMHKLATMDGSSHIPKPHPRPVFYFPEVFGGRTVFNLNRVLSRSEYDAARKCKLGSMVRDYLKRLGVYVSDQYEAPVPKSKAYFCRGGKDGQTVYKLLRLLDPFELEESENCRTDDELLRYFKNLGVYVSHRFEFDKAEKNAYPRNFGGLECPPEVLAPKAVECPECWNTGLFKGWGAPCSHGCKQP